MFKWSSSDKIAIPIALLTIVGVAILLNFLLKNKSEKVRHIPLMAISVALVLLEVVKQIYLLATNTYQLWNIPVHFCSFIVVIIALAEFLPKKLAKYLDIPSCVFSILALLLLLAYPRSIISNSSSAIFKNFANFHAFFFHILVASYPIMKLTLVKIEFNIKQCLSLIVGVLIYAIYAIPIAFSIRVNYMNILQNAWQPLENFRLSCGQIAYEIVWIAICIAFCELIYFILYLINKLIYKRRNKNAT